jgi:hypothetical protein
VGVPHHHPTECFKAKFPSEVVRHLGKDRAPKHSEGLRITHGTCEECDGNPSRKAHSFVECAVAHAYNRVYRTPPHVVGDRHGVEHGGSTIMQCAPWTRLWRVQSCNSTLQDIVQVLVTNSNSCFSIGRTYERGYVATAIFIRVMMHTVRPIPPGTYKYAKLI